MWDRLRLLAFLDVAAFHMRGVHPFAGVGLPLFLVLRFALLSRAPTPPACGKVVEGNVRRLLLPWLAWSSIFGVYVLLSALRHGLAPAQVFRVEMLLSGPADHLWFLLFAAVGGVAVNFADRLTQHVSTRALAIGCVGCASALLAVGENAALPHPLSAWMFASPSLPLGLLAGRLLARPGPSPRRAWILLLAFATLAMTAGYLTQRGDGEAACNVSRYGLALAALALGAVLPHVRDTWTPRLTPLLLGAYLIHPLVYQQTLMRLESGGQLRAGSFVALAVTVPIALAATAALRRTPLRAVL